MRSLRMLFALVIMAVGLGALAAPAAVAREVVEQPFITAKFYKQNISLEQFRVNPRSYFRSEAAFDLIVDYVGDEIGQPLTSSQFFALVRSEQVKVRDCAAGESINTGALAGNQFHWFVRSCRAGEQILQVQVNSKWIDVVSLNCLNAVEDKTPVLSPLLTPVPSVVLSPRPQPVTTYQVIPGFTVGGLIFLAEDCCCGDKLYALPGVSVPAQQSQTTTFGNF